MRKPKGKTAAQKRRARAKVKSRQQEKERENWVQDRLQWISVSDHHNLDFVDDIDDKVQLDLLQQKVEIEDDEIVISCEDDQSVENETKENENKEPLHDFSIICWNVLADSYCSRSSHKNLPRKSQSRVFNRNQRQHHVRQTLKFLDEKLSPDLVALQEVDSPLQGKNDFARSGIKIETEEALMVVSQNHNYLSLFFVNILVQYLNA